MNVTTFNWSGTVVPDTDFSSAILQTLLLNANNNFRLCALISLQVLQSFLLHSGCALTRQLRAFFNWTTPLRRSSLVNKTDYPHFRVVLVFSIQRYDTSLVSGFGIPPNPHCRPVWVVMGTGHTQSFERDHVIIERKHDKGGMFLHIWSCASLSKMILR